MVLFKVFFSLTYLKNSLGFTLQLEARRRRRKGEGEGKGEGGGGGRKGEGEVTRSYKEKANSNRPIGPYKAVRYLT